VRVMQLCSDLWSNLKAQRVVKLTGRIKVV
jgi:hypothetical protein